MESFYRGRKMVNGIFVLSKEDSVSLVGDQICVVSGSNKTYYDLEKVQGIAIKTVDEGPFFDDMALVIYIKNGSDTLIFVPSEHACYEKFLFDEISKVLPIDHKKIIEASSCTESATFTLYNRSRQKKEATEESQPESGLKIYLEDDEVKVSGSIDLGYIGTFTDEEIEIDDSLEEIREWDIVTENLDEDCSDDEVISFLNKYFNDFATKISRNIENINGTFLLHVFTDMDASEINFMVIDELFIEENLRYGNEEDIAEIYNPVREGLNSLSPYIGTPNDGTIPKGHIESVLRSFYPMFDFDCFIENIVPECVGLHDGEISFQCSDDFDEAILCGAYAELHEDLSFDDWHNF